jgi:hypothetical protein
VDAELAARPSGHRRKTPENQRLHYLSAIKSSSEDDQEVDRLRVIQRYTKGMPGHPFFVLS